MAYRGVDKLISPLQLVIDPNCLVFHTDGPKSQFLLKYGKGTKTQNKINFVKNKKMHASA